METRNYNVYKFDELTEKQQANVIQNYYDINVNHEWYESVYEDAENIGLKITGFDIDRASYVEGDLICDFQDCIEKILKDHGQSCDTFKLASEYKPKLTAIRAILETDESAYDELEGLEKGFIQELSECYLSMLRKEYEYLTSSEAIKETIECNDYWFNDSLKID